MVAGPEKHEATRTFHRLDFGAELFGIDASIEMLIGGRVKLSDLLLESADHFEGLIGRHMDVFHRNARDIHRNTSWQDRFRLLLKAAHDLRHKQRKQSDCRDDQRQPCDLFYFVGAHFQPPSPEEMLRP